MFVLGATNHPWDIDSALRRPGRFDRMLLVLPPDAPAREAILRHNLRNRPIAGIDLGKLAKATEHYSGADLAHLCDTAAERALAESMRTGRVRPLTTADVLTAAREVQPSTGPWFATARNVALFGNTDGSYDELAAYLEEEPEAVSRAAAGRDPRAEHLREPGPAGRGRAGRARGAGRGPGRRRLLLGAVGGAADRAAVRRGAGGRRRGVAAAPDDERGHRLRALHLSLRAGTRRPSRPATVRHAGPDRRPRPPATPMPLQRAGRLGEARAGRPPRGRAGPDAADAHLLLADVPATSPTGRRARAGLRADPAARPGERRGPPRPGRARRRAPPARPGRWPGSSTAGRLDPTLPEVLRTVTAVLLAAVLAAADAVRRRHWSPSGPAIGAARAADRGARIAAAGCSA